MSTHSDPEGPEHQCRSTTGRSRTGVLAVRLPHPGTDRGDGRLMTTLDGASRPEATTIRPAMLDPDTLEEVEQALDEAHGNGTPRTKSRQAETETVGLAAGEEQNGIPQAETSHP